MEGFRLAPETKLESPKEELAFLRERLSKLEEEIGSGEREPTGEEPAERLLRTYKDVPADEVLTEDAQVSTEQIDAIVLDLPPEEHDDRMADLLSVIQTKGVKNALTIVSGMNNPHLEDDFHRFVAAYIKGGYPAPDMKERDPLFQALSMTLYEVALPNTSDESTDLKKLISAMEQFYAGMQAVAGVGKKRRHFTLEIAQAHDTEEVVFYVSVPTERKAIFEKQLLGTFPDARMHEHNADYNVFADGGMTVGAVAELGAHEVFPLKLYDSFDTDPLSVILNTFSKLEGAGEGAALQLVLRGAPESAPKNFRSILEKIQQGTPLKEALGGGGLAKEFGKVAKDMILGGSKKQDEKKDSKVDEVARDHIKKKIEAPLFSVVIRVIASSGDQSRAEAIRSEIVAAFNQFEEGGSNRLGFRDIKERQMKQFTKDFTFRLFSEKDALILNTKELTTLVHFPSSVLKGASQLKRAKAITAPAPLDVPEEGVILGVNRHRGKETEIKFAPQDRVRHFYVIGQTGTGKTTILKNMIIQDIQNGEGVCLIDPHGTDISDVMANIPEERFDDVVYFDPAYTPRPMGLNMFEYDARFPEQKSFVVDELLSIFNKLFDMKTAGGPMFEQYFRNAALLVMDDPDSGNTLIDLSRVLADKAYRQLKLSRSSNPIVVQFWEEVAEKAGGEASLQNIIPYITSKFDIFLTNEIMRPVIAQERSAFNLRDIMDNKKILLVNLSKGRLGDINANLIGLIIVGKILMAALSRVDTPSGQLPPFYLYIDEFQNITTDSISSILSEARKYGLGLNIAHQFIKQLDEGIRDAVFGNVGSVAAFRVSSDDAEYLEKQFEPTFSASDLMNVDNWNAYVKLLMNGRPEAPFSLATLAPEKGSEANLEIIKQLSYQKYGRDRAEVEKEVMERYKKKSSVPEERPPLR